MMRSVFVLIGLLMCSSPVMAKLEITSTQLAEGPLGPERKSLEFYPLDELVFRIGLSGVKTIEEGRCDLELSFRLMTPEGRTVIDQKGPIQRPLMLGGGQVMATAAFLIGLNAPEGVYTARIAIKDKVSNDEAVYEGKLTCKPTAFRVLMPRFFYDPAEKMPAPVSGVIGDSRHFKLKVVGFSQANNQVRTTMALQILDAAGAEIPTPPLLVKAEITDPKEVVKAVQLTFNGMINYNRSGKFIVRFLINDLNGKAITKFDMPIEVREP